MLSRLTDLDQRVQSLEQLMYRAAGSAESVVHIPDVDAPASVAGQVEMELISEDELRAMSSTEVAQVANSRGLPLDRFMDREHLIDLVLRPEPIEGRLQNIREEISHFINEVQPSLKQILQCSRRCIDVCPSIQVVDCWATNKQKIQEI
jgi:Tfp pilus assembly protein PilO